jgi:zinc D-Ala-D-Ala dipeptidase
MTARRRVLAVLAPLALTSLALSAACATRQALEIPRNAHGLPVVNGLALHRALVAADPELELVDLAEAVPGARLDLRYATEDNFMGRPLYPVARAFLRRPAAEALAAAHAELAAQGLGVKVFDAYRPYRVTVAMWEQIGDPDYVADPAQGSRHNRGAAVDVTLFELDGGRELLMPTPYDDFTRRAHHDFGELPEQVLANRALLRRTLERHGFAPLASEWWHYDFAGWQRFPLMDLSLEELARELDGAGAGGP